MQHKKAVSTILIILLILLLCPACSNSLFNQWINPSLTEEEKTPEYAIENHYKISEGDYKYLVLGKFLFVENIEGREVGYETKLGNYNFEYPFYNSTRILRENKGPFHLTIGLTYSDQYAIDITVFQFEYGELSDKPYNLYDSTGNKFVVFPNDDKYFIWWLKVLDNIPEGYKVFIESDGHSYEILNKETIENKLGVR